MGKAFVVTGVRRARAASVWSWLAQELKSQIPDLDPFLHDRRLVSFAYHDLKTCLSVKWKVTDPYSLHLVNAAEHHPDEVRAFLKIWVTRWLEKWRSRVALYYTMPKVSRRRLERRWQAQQIFTRMKKRGELQKMVVQKLVTQGEICMPKLIAENLILEELTQHLNGNNRQTAITTNALIPIEILRGLLPKIEMLNERKHPFIYLKIG